MQSMLLKICAKKSILLKCASKSQTSICLKAEEDLTWMHHSHASHGDYVG